MHTNNTVKSAAIDHNIKATRSSTAYNTADKLLGLRHYQQALISYNVAIDLRPDFAEAYCGRGATHIALGNLQLALADANRAVVLNPNYAIGYYLRGSINYTLGNLEIAKNNLIVAAKLFKEQGNQLEHRRVSIILEKIEDNNPGMVTSKPA